MTGQQIMWFLCIMHEGYREHRLKYVLLAIAFTYPLIHIAVAVAQPGSLHGGGWLPRIPAWFVGVIAGSWLGVLGRQLQTADGRSAFVRGLLHPFRLFELPGWVQAWILWYVGYCAIGVILFSQLSNRRAEWGHILVLSILCGFVFFGRTSTKMRQRVLKQMAQADPYSPDAWMRWPR